MIWILSVLVLRFLLSAVPTAWGAEIDIRGFIDTYQGARLEDPHEYVSSRTRLRMEGYLSDDNGYAFVSFNAVENRIVEDETGVHLREAYLEYSSSRFDVRVGNQIIIWGRSDGFYVTDTISPKDYSEFLARDFDDMRIPITAARGRFLTDKTTFEILCIPIFTPAVMPYRQDGVPGDWDDSPWAYDLPADATVHEAHLPEKKLGNSEFAAKYSFSTSAFDVALSGFYTWDDMAVMHYEDDTISPKHHRLAFWGMDFSVPVQSCVVRGEFAYRQGKYFATQSGAPLKKDTLLALLGMDVYPGNEWSISAQVYNQCILEYSSELEESQHVTYGSLRISKELFRNTLTLLTMSFWGLEYKELYSRNSATYKLTDSVGLSAGIDWFEGEQGMFGMYNKNSSVFCECKYSF